MEAQVYEKAVALWQRKRITTDAALAEALNGHSIAFAYHSGRIENELITFNDTREIFEHDGVTSYTGDLRTLFEISNAKDANEFLLDSFREKRPLDEALVKEFQRRLTQKTYDIRRWQLGERPGEYKRHDYITGKNEIGASPDDVSEEMKKLLAEMADVPDEKAMTAAAYYHAKFENIHPFADGNGRTGRLTMNYFLLLHNHPPVIIHEEDRNAYYAALEAWDEWQELTPLVDFLKDQTAKTWEKQIERAERKARGKEMGTIAGQLETMRNIGDYSIDLKVSRSEALRAIEGAEKFNAAIRTHVREQQQKESRQSTEQTEDTQEQEQIAQVNKADLNELESATALLKNQRATDNTTFKGHEITPQQNDTLDLLEQIKKHVQADKATMAKLESAGLSPEKDITVHKVARPGKFFSKETQGLEVVSRTRDSLMLIRGRCLFIYELKLLELQAPAQGVPGEKLDLEWPKTQEKARGAQAQEQERKRTQGRGRGLSL